MGATSTTVLQTRSRFQHPRREGGTADWRPLSSADPSDLDVRRRRRCVSCGFRFTTYESLAMSRAEFERLAEDAADREDVANQPLVNRRPCRKEI
jgi:transcriptional regulator NrdR family protein